MCRELLISPIGFGIGDPARPLKTVERPGALSRLPAPPMETAMRFQVEWMIEVDAKTPAQTRSARPETVVMVWPLDDDGESISDHPVIADASDGTVFS